jgi:murein tripeptide amidase MpaA
MENIGAIIERQRLIHKLQPSNADDFAYNVYHPLEEIHAWIDQMVQTYPDLATTFTVGQSYEKRDLKALKISSKKPAVKLDGTPVNAKKAVWWDGGKLWFFFYKIFKEYFSLGIHAREWISPATVIYLAHALLSNYNKDETITHLVDTFDYYILPVFNADGYVYTWTNGKV